jgi:hypothetical protein
VGSPAALGVEAGRLSDGWVVRWRARAVSATAASGWLEWQRLTVDLPKPAVGDLKITPVRTVNGGPATKSLTPTLSATATSPSGAAMRVEFEIEHDPSAPANQGSGTIWSGGADDIASGSVGGVTVPAGALSDEWLVRWRARAVAGGLSAGWSRWQQVKVDLIQAGEEPLAQTTGPVIQTDQSFAVAAWLRWSDSDQAHTVIQQSGEHIAPFRLGNDPADGLVFTLSKSDSTDAVAEGAVSGVAPPENQWFHLAGVYDAGDNTASLYLDGKLLKTEQISFPTWTANAPMTLGAEGVGDLDEVRAFNRALSNEEVVALRDGVETPAAAKTAATQPTTAQPTTTGLPAPNAVSKPPSTRAEARAAALAGGPYYDLCWRNETEARKPAKPVYSTIWSSGGYHMTRNAWCGIQKVGSAGLELRIGPAQRAEGMDADATLIGYSWNTKPTDSLPTRIRNFEFDITMNNFVFVERGNTAYRRWADIEIGMKNAGDSGSKCKLISQTSYKASWQEWSAGKMASFLFASYEEDGAGTDKIAWCQPRFWAKITRRDTPLVKFTINSDAYPQLRCDSATYMLKTLGSGCVFDRALLTYVTHETLPGDPTKSSNKPNIKDEVLTAYRNVPSHIWTALHRPQLTEPSEANKSIPGYNGLGLIRSVDEKWNTKNNNKVRDLCRNLFAEYDTKNAEIGKPATVGNPPVPVPAKDRRVYECDEFPFESTIQGAWTSAEGQNRPEKRAFSIRPVYWRNNGNDGLQLRTFYELNRVLGVDRDTRKTEYDPFRVDPKVPQAPPIQ